MIEINMEDGDLCIFVEENNNIRIYDKDENRIFEINKEKAKDIIEFLTKFVGEE